VIAILTYLQIEFKSLPSTRWTVSGGTDPGTSFKVFLFEDFVPPEDRQQLSAGAQSNRMLASFLSPGKTKQRKQAAISMDALALSDTFLGV
jgi:hypothetical protein